MITVGARIFDARDRYQYGDREGVLTISGGTKEESEKKENGRVLRRERRYGSFRREMRLGSEINEADIKAKYEDSVLEVAVPKAPDAPRRTTEVKVS